MLDADETAGFDEAMRRDPALTRAYREVECLTAVIAAAVTHPVTPQSGQLESLHLRLGLNVAKSTNWLGISGWAAAAAVLLLWLLPNRDKAPENLTRREARSARVVVTKPAHLPSATAVTAAAASPVEGASQKKSPERPPQTLGATTELSAVVKRETQQLTQEIETLRSRVQSAQERDRRNSEAVAGFSRLVVMRMKVPETSLPPEEKAEGLFSEGPTAEEPPISAVIGDALAGTGSSKLKVSDAPTPFAPVKALSAISIYDPAQDTGTIVIAGDIPSDPESGPPQLWILTDDAVPIYVGTLPEFDHQDAQTAVDFSFGIPSTIPKGFILTRGSKGTPVPPTAANTLLAGPQ
jgi:hypothetical protein